MVVLVKNLLIGLLQLNKLLHELFVTKDRIDVVRWVVDDPSETQLSVRRDWNQKHYEQNAANAFSREIFHSTLLFQVATSWPVWLALRFRLATRGNNFVFVPVSSCITKSFIS